MEIHLIAMKKLIVAALLCACGLCAKAEIKFQSLDNMDGTTIVLADDNTPKRIKVTDVVLLNDGKKYPARSVRCNLGDGNAVYTLNFDRITYFKDTKVQLKVNGRKHSVDVRKGL